MSFDNHQAEEFEKSKTIYETALKESGYDAPLNYNPTNGNRRNRGRKIIWFNPPFNNSVKTNVGRKFLGLVKKNFPRNHRYHQIFNRNTLKLSYCCTPNLGNIIKQHNSKILKGTPAPQLQQCNCRTKQNCPLNGRCLTSCIVYKATVTTNSDTHTYYGLCEGEFKSRYYNHTKSFRSRKYENETELSKFLWKLKDESKDYALSWDIAVRATPYKCGTRRCDLCLAEKVCIIRAEPKGLLNKRTELISKCRHRNKFALVNLK